MKNKIQQFLNEYTLTDIAVAPFLNYIETHFDVQDVEFRGTKDSKFSDFLNYMASPMKEMTLRVAFDPKPLIKHVEYIKSQLEVLEEMIQQMKPTLL